jgi:ankyrin repeat protein
MKVVNLLLARKEIQINQAGNDGATPLFIACQNSHVRVVNALLARKEIQINQPMNNGTTPLHVAHELKKLK